MAMLAAFRFTPLSFKIGLLEHVQGPMAGEPLFPDPVGISLVAIDPASVTLSYAA
jgi:hypothetical protein